MSEGVKLVGEGGTEIEFDLPLAAVYVEQLNKGSLVPADEKAAAKLAEVGVLQGTGTATADRLRDIEAREQSLAAREANLGARETAAASAEAEQAEAGDAPADDAAEAKPKGKASA